MTLLAFAYEPEDFDATTGHVYHSQANTGAGFVESDITLNYSPLGATATKYFSAAAGTIWGKWFGTHNHAYIDAAVPLFVLSSGATDLFRVRIPNGTTDKFLALEAWDGTAWVVLQTSATALAANLGDFQVKLVISDTGSFVLKFAGTEYLNFSGDTLRTAATTVDRIRFEEWGSSTVSIEIAGVMIADEDCWDWAIHEQHSYATNTSLTQTWEGPNTNIDEWLWNNELNAFINTNTSLNDHVLQFHDMDAAYASGYEVVQVRMRGKARKIAGAALNLAVLVGNHPTTPTLYEGGTVTTLTRDWKNAEVVMATNPATAAAWTVTQINDYVFGVRAKA